MSKILILQIYLPPARLGACLKPAPPFDPGLSCYAVPRLVLPDTSGWIPETDKPYMCSSCGKGYTHIFTLNRHRRTVCGKIRNTSGKWKCPRCTRSYVTEGNLVRHVRFECGVRRKFCCIFCNRKFTQRCSLIRHLRNFHNESFDSNSGGAGVPADNQPTINPCHVEIKTPDTTRMSI
nr:zinc finger protein 467-like [Megalopta genalis]